VTFALTLIALALIGQTTLFLFEHIRLKRAQTEITYLQHQAKSWEEIAYTWCQVSDECVCKPTMKDIRPLCDNLVPEIDWVVE